MNLLAPVGLAALALLPVILAIHLWRVRHRRYDAHFRAWIGEIESACRARRAHYVRVSTAVAPRTLVLDTLRREGVLQ